MRIDGWLQDLRIAVRSLAKQKAWTAVAITTLALGSGANWAFAAGAMVLALATFLACYLPARRAARLDPMVALRAE